MFTKTLILSILAYLIYFLIFNKNYHQQQQDQVNITCLIIEFENFQNDLFETTKNVCEQNICNPMIIYSEKFIYPPISVENFSSSCKITLIELDRSIHQSQHQKDVYNLLEKNNFLLILTDSSRIISKDIYEILLSEIQESNSDALLIPVNNKNKLTEKHCQQYFHFDVKRWTLQLNQEHGDCFFKDDFAIFIQKESFFKLSYPLVRPMIQSLVIQAQVLKINLHLLNKLNLIEKKSLFQSSEYFQRKHDYLEQERLISMYHKLGIKKVIHHDGSIQWFGCDRHQPRCFGTIIDDLPDYLVKDRWLPPCCLRNLETTGKYVFNLLEKFHIRYWLEGGSLLGAARNGQIIPWDYDIDIGIYQEDMSHLPMLEKLFHQEPGHQMEDGQGFIWERALEGKFIKVHFSRHNRIHVDIFPFKSIDDIMTKDTWFDNHPQDMPFPEHYLKPLETIQFIGLNVSIPNKVREFLEMKFGQGSIEKPKYQ